MMLQLIFVLSTLISITVSSDVFGLVGDSVQLDIRNPVPEFHDLSLVFNRTYNVLKYNKKHNDSILYSHYKARVEFNDKTYSLTLKNLQKTDSGLYEVRASADEVIVVAEYRLSVLDPVETPVLTYQLNRDTCNITLTCRGHDLAISSSCHNETCKKKEVTSPGGIALSLSVRNNSIICNHSNLVSWKEDVLKMGELKRLCADESKDPVETPVLTYQLNRDTCNITLTCRGHDLSISSSCHNETCKKKEVTSPGGFALSLSVRNNSIICNHSNLVSWKEDVLEMGELKQLCADESKDPVETPVLTYQLNRDTCNITLTCRGHDLSISSNCHNETCKKKEVTSPGGVALSLSVRNNSIICNHSNLVSWKEDVLEMGELKQLCADRSKGSVSPSAGVSVRVLYCIFVSFILSALVIVSLILSALVSVHICSEDAKRDLLRSQRLV